MRSGDAAYWMLSFAGMPALVGYALLHGLVHPAKANLALTISAQCVVILVIALFSA